MIKTMTYLEKGWVVINENHPIGVPPYAVPTTFSSTKSMAIMRFCEGSGSKWRYWRDKFNFRCVRASSTITTL